METKIAKIGISQESDQALDRLLTKVNDGFTGGRVTKSELASWIVHYFENHAFETNLDKIRKDHFDQVAYLESVLKEMKRARKNGADAPDLNTLLAPVATPIKGNSRKKNVGDLTGSQGVYLNHGTKEGTDDPNKQRGSESETSKRGQTEPSASA